MIKWTVALTSLFMLALPTLPPAPRAADAPHVGSADSASLLSDSEKEAGCLPNPAVDRLRDDEFARKLADLHPAFIVHPGAVRRLTSGGRKRRGPALDLKHLSEVSRRWMPRERGAAEGDLVSLVTPALTELLLLEKEGRLTDLFKPASDGDGQAGGSRPAASRRPGHYATFFVRSWRRQPFPASKPAFWVEVDAGANRKPKKFVDDDPLILRTEERTIGDATWHYREAVLCLDLFTSAGEPLVRPGDRALIFTIEGDDTRRTSFSLRYFTPEFLLFEPVKQNDTRNLLKEMFTGIGPPQAIEMGIK